MMVSKKSDRFLTKVNPNQLWIKRIFFFSPILILRVNSHRLHNYLGTEQSTELPPTIRLTINDIVNDYNIIPIRITIMYKPNKTLFIRNYCKV